MTTPATTGPPTPGGPDRGQTRARVSVCTCGARIRFVVTVAGKRMPVDLEPHPDGNVVPVASDDPAEPRARVLTKTELETYGGVRFRAHFTVCPDEHQHRRRPMPVSVALDVIRGTFDVEEIHHG